MGLRMTLYQWRHMPADMVVNDYIACPLVIHSTGFGLSEDVDIVSTDETSDVVSRQFHPQIVNPEDIDKIQMPVVTYDREATPGATTRCARFSAASCPWSRWARRAPGSRPGTS